MRRNCLEHSQGPPEFVHLFLSNVAAEFNDYFRPGADFATTFTEGPARPATATELRQEHCPQMTQICADEVSLALPPNTRLSATIGVICGQETRVATPSAQTA